MKDKLSLAALLDEDREMVLANLARDQALPAAQQTLEKAIDRVMYRYVEACGDEALGESTQQVLQAMKNTLPVMDTVGEAKIWKKQYDASERQGLRFGPLALILLMGGLVFVWAAVLGVLVASRMAGVLAFVKALLPVALGCAGLFWAGVLSSRPAKKKASQADGSSERIEYLVDREKAWHCLRGAMLQADGQLARVHELDELHRQCEKGDGDQGGLAPQALELFSELLESAYAAGDDGAGESASAIRFYLHNAGIDVVDFEAGRENWFEFLPASRPGTIRPALVSQGKLIRKGLASASNNAL